MNTTSIPDSLDSKLIHDASTISGWLQPREMRFLSLAVLNQTCEGEIVELGCYHGKSTSVIAGTLRHLGRGKMNTVDPINPEPMQRNLSRLNLLDQVTTHHQSSLEFAKTWDSPIAFLWHDGANDFKTVSQDCRNLFPHLVDQSIVAFHDVLNASGERIHVFDQMVLNSPHFGWTGVCGSIGFGQFHKEPVRNAQMIRNKNRLSKKLKRLKPYHSASQPSPTGLRHLAYRLLRSRVPHGPVHAFSAA